MSSARKDARWQLITTLANEAGLDDLGALEYPVAQRLLDAAEAVLDFVPEATIQALADKWNTPEGFVPPAEDGPETITLYHDRDDAEEHLESYIHDAILGYCESVGIDLPTRDLIGMAAAAWAALAQLEVAPNVGGTP